MNKNIKKIVSISTLALSMGAAIGLAAGLGNKSISKADAAHSDTFTTSDYVYCDISSFPEWDDAANPRAAASWNWNEYGVGSESVLVYENMYKCYFPNYGNAVGAGVVRHYGTGTSNFMKFSVGDFSASPCGDIISVTGWGENDKNLKTSVMVTVKQIFDGKEMASDAFPVRNGVSTTLSRFDNYLTEWDGTYIVSGYYSDSALTTKITSLTASSAKTIYAKCVKGKYVFFTNNYAWDESSIKVANTGSSAINQDYGLKKLYTNGSSQGVFYGAVPSDTTGLVFKGTQGGSDTKTVALSAGTLDDTNAWYISGDGTGMTGRTAGTWSVTSDFYGLKSGDRFYVDVKNNSVLEASAKITMKYWNATDAHYSKAGTQVTDSKVVLNLSLNDIFELTVPLHNRYWINVLACRYDSAYDPYTDGDHIWNQTADKTLSKANTGSKFLSYVSLSNNNNYDMGAVWNDSQKFDEVHSKIFGYHLMQTAGATCDPAGVNTNLATLASNWTALKAEYDDLESTTQYALYVGTANPSGSWKEKGLSLYDYIVSVKQYSLITNTDFINRGSGSGSGARILPFVIGGDNTGSMFAIIASVLVMAVAIGGYFLLRKKRI